MKYIKLVFLGGCVGGFTFLLLEIIIRIFFPVPMEPGVSLTLNNEIPGIQSNVRYSFDGYRLRKADWDDDQEADSIRILCFGGNATTTIFQKTEDTWWGKLADRISKETGKNIEVGAMAKTSNGHFILPSVVNAEKIVKKYKPDLIVCCYGFGDTLHYEDYVYTPDKINALRKGVPRGLKYSLAKISHVMRLMRNKKTRRHLKEVWKPLNAPNYHRDLLFRDRLYYRSCPELDQMKRDENDPLNEFIDGIKAFSELAIKSGCRLLVVGEPSIHNQSLAKDELSLMTSVHYPTKPVPGKGSGHRVKAETIALELQRFYAAASDYCKQNEIEWVNLHGMIPQTIEYFLGETDVTDVGASEIADKLMPAVTNIVNGL
ncbi:MAG: hypothetical protein HN584_04650 [Akkermansiaceae bacterium]|jgi:hypothetical protein|nr:hypothetical protein [Akkermansiaceae bacterium]